jgi:FkbM family methyltransferase
LRKIAITEFVPPIIFRALNYVKRRWLAVRNQNVKSSPFNNLPNSFEAKWILDIGANVGDVAVAALTSYRESKVICFEPVQKTYDALSVRLGPYGDRVQLHKFALSNTTGTGEINITTFHGANSIETQANFHKECNPHVLEVGKEQIELVRLDDYSDRFPCERIDVMKIDVEGHELDVLKGGIQFISTRVDIIIIEVAMMRDNSWENQAVFEIFTVLNNAGFRLLNIMDLHRTSDGSALLTQMDCVFRNKRNLVERGIGWLSSAPIESQESIR